eukprot:2040269-Ditylum_brightwellii.AAC.1
MDWANREANTAETIIVREKIIKQMIQKYTATPEGILATHLPTTTKTPETTPETTPTATAPPTTTTMAMTATKRQTIPDGP